MTATATYRRLAAGLERVPPRAVQAAAKVVKAELTRSARAATGDGRFSGAPWARLTIQVDVRAFSGEESVAEVTPARKAGGPWRWIEDGTTRHMIGRKADRSGRNRRRLHFPDGWVAGPVEHRGASGKQAWSQAIASSADRAVDAMRREALGVL